MVDNRLVYAMLDLPIILGKILDELPDDRSPQLDAALEWLYRVTDDLREICMLTRDQEKQFEAAQARIREAGRKGNMIHSRTAGEKRERDRGDVRAAMKELGRRANNKKLAEHINQRRAAGDKLTESRVGDLKREINNSAVF